MKALIRLIGVLALVAIFLLDVEDTLRVLTCDPDVVGDAVLVFRQGPVRPAGLLERVVQSRPDFGGKRIRRPTDQESGHSY